MSNTDEAPFSNQKKAFSLSQCHQIKTSLNPLHSNTSLQNIETFWACISKAFKNFRYIEGKSQNQISLNELESIINLILGFKPKEKIEKIHQSFKAMAPLLSVGNDGS